MLAVKFDRRAVDDQLAQLVGKPIRKPIAFDLALDITSGPGLQWWMVMRALADQLRNADSLYRHPLLVAPLTQSVMVALLLAARHDYSSQLVTSVDPAAPAAVERARQYIEDHVDEPLTAVEIAAAAGVSLRASSTDFRQRSRPPRCAICGTYACAEFAPIFSPQIPNKSVWPKSPTGGDSTTSQIRRPLPHDVRGKSVRSAAVRPDPTIVPTRVPVPRGTVSKDLEVPGRRMNGNPRISGGQL